MTHPMLDLVGPTSRFYRSQRLRLHYVDWGNDAAPPLVLIHGGRDHARSWDWVARDLRHDFHIVAGDLRGHGDSAWSEGGMYSLADHVLDLAQMLESVGRSPPRIVGHSLGGAVALSYAGVYPERVTQLVAIEGLYFPPHMAQRLAAMEPWERLQSWVEQMQEHARRSPRRYPSIEAAAARMREENRFLSREQALHLTAHGVMRNEDGSYAWKFDKYVRSVSPHAYDPQASRRLWSRITCPTLLVRGSDSWAGDPAADGLLGAFQNARSVTIDAAGHFVHHDRLDAFVALLREFFAGA